MFGFALSLSGDGSTLAVGAQRADGAESDGTKQEYSGLSFVYRYECGNWSQVGQDLMGDIGDLMGISVDLSHTGERLAVGAPTDFLVPLGRSGTATALNHKFD